jgi:hypothetical protein
VAETPPILAGHCRAAARPRTSENSNLVQTIRNSAWGPEMAILHDCSKENRLWSGLARPWPGDISFLPSRVGPRLEPARKIRIFSERSETRHGVLKWQSCTIARREIDFGAVWLGRGPGTSRSCRAASGRGSSQLGKFEFSRNDPKLGTGSLNGNPARLLEEKSTLERFGSAVARGHLVPAEPRRAASGPRPSYSLGMIRNSARGP